MRAADLDLLQQGYRRGYVAWERVRAALDRILPPCDGCGAPANAGGWLPGERLCAGCAMERMGRKAEKPE